MYHTNWKKSDFWWFWQMTKGLTHGPSGQWNKRLPWFRWRNSLGLKITGSIWNNVMLQFTIHFANQKGGLMPSYSSLHAEGTLGKILNPKLPLTAEWQCLDGVWQKKLCVFEWSLYKSNPFTTTHHKNMQPRSTYFWIFWRPRGTYCFYF